ncbi:hypothetical protein B0H14DRAFT_3475143 [Mycena olivaceomarginata]|nr:hypothetical protein B0H14DRAFT_3475143 [Mycena olivaceomarginata]
MVNEGKATEKAAKPRAKGRRKEAGEPRGSTRMVKKGSAETRADDNDEEEDAREGGQEDASEGEEGPCQLQHGKPSGVAAREAQRQRLLALAGRKAAAVDSEGEWGGKGPKLSKTKGGKRKRDAEDDGAPTAKVKSRKRDRLTDDNEDAAPAKKSASTRKHRRPAAGEDEAPAAKKRKTSDPSCTSMGSGKLSTATSGAVPVVARPKPRPLYKVSASRTTPRSESPSHRTPSSRTGSPARTTTAPGQPAPVSTSQAASPPHEPSPTCSASSSTRGSGSSGTSHGRANFVKGKRGGPPGVRLM